MKYIFELHDIDKDYEYKLFNYQYASKMYDALWGVCLYIHNTLRQHQKGYVPLTQEQEEIWTEFSDIVLKILDHNGLGNLYI